MHAVERERCEVGADEVTIQARAITGLLNRRHYDGRPERPHGEKEESHSASLTELFERIPGVATFEEELEFGVIGVQPDPNNTNEDADDDGFPTKGPAHFRHQRAHLVNAPKPDEHLEEVHPITRRSVETILKKSQNEDQGVRDNAGVD